MCGADILHLDVLIIKTLQVAGVELGDAVVAWWWWYGECSHKCGKHCSISFGKHFLSTRQGMPHHTYDLIIHMDQVYFWMKFQCKTIHKQPSFLGFKPFNQQNFVKSIVIKGLNPKKKLFVNSLTLKFRQKVCLVWMVWCIVTLSSERPH